jgi:hypothetical protein
MKTIQYSLKAIILLSMLTGLLSLNTIGQTDFNLSDYKNPDYQYRSLDFGLGLTGNNSINKSDYSDNYTNKRNNNSFNGNLISDYYSTKNSKYYQGSQNYRFNFSTYGSKNKTEAGISTLSESTNKANSQYLSVAVNSSNRFYNSRKRFVETNLNFSGELGNSTSKNTSDIKTYPYSYKNQSGNYLISASIPLLVGTGRIEEVQDARLAVYILDDLLKSGDLTRTPDKEEILALSEFITQTKNQRFFDSRIRKIAEITAIDSFLTANGLKGQSDASYYTLINDNWDNSNGPVRATGRRFSIGVAPGFDTEFDKATDYSVDSTNSTAFSYFKSKNTDQLDSWNLDAIAQFVCEKPINLTWQRSSSASLGYSLYSSNSIYKTYNDDMQTGEIKDSEKSPNFSVGITHSYGYYPNSRTSIRFGANAYLQQYWRDRKTDDGLTVTNDETNIVSNLFLNCNYYFSPQLRFSVYVNEAYQFTKEIVNGTGGNPNDVTKANYFSSNINASITYSLF